MKKIFNLISSSFFVIIPILSSSCSPQHQEEKSIINLNNYVLTDNEYVFRTSISQNSTKFWKKIEEGNVVIYIPYLFSSWVFADSSIPEYQDKKNMLNDIKDYFKFAEQIKSENVYYATLFINQSETNFLNFYKSIENDRFSSATANGLFYDNNKEFYIKQGVSEIVVDKFKNEDLVYGIGEFYNFDQKTNSINLLKNSDFELFSNELIKNKNVENNEVWVTIDYNFTFSEPDLYEQSLRIRYAPNPNSDFTWHNGSKNPMVFWYDSNVR